MINTLFFVLCLITIVVGHTVEDKSPIKSIRTKSGYTVDCVEINKQPAFDHPLLKNHKLQRTPSFERKINDTSVEISPTKSIYGLERVRCPKGTVPIRRMTKYDIIQSKSLFNDHRLIQNGRESHARVFLKTTSGPYHGVSGATSVYNPKVNKDQSSMSHMYVRNGQGDGTNEIAVGWHVFPQLYNDFATHLYSVWTPDNYKTGCYNLLCQGFIQTDRSYHLGSRVAKTSTYGGEIIEMALSLSQDSEGNWWLKVENNDIGYFPAALFSNLATADQVGWGGYTVTPTGTQSPPMGSGHFPNGNFLHGGYFRHIAFQNESRKDYGPSVSLEDTFNNAPKDCYRVAYYGDQKGDIGYSLQFGGPGGNCYY